MARLKTCRTCREVVAKNSVVCVYCGRVNPAAGVIRKTVSAVVTLVVIAIPAAVVVIGLAGGEG